MTTQTQTTEERLSNLEGAYGQVNERFNDLTQAVREGDAALREQIRQGDAALREADAALRTDMNERFNELARGQAALGEQIRRGDAALREVETNLRASQEAFRSEVHATLQRQTYLIIGSLGAMWASMVGGFIALFLAM